MGDANAASADSANKSSSLLIRSLSALMLIPLIVGGAYVGVWGVTALIVLSVVIGVLEIYHIFAVGHYRPSRPVGLALALSLCAAAAFEWNLRFDLTIVIIGVAVIASLLAFMARTNREGALVDWALTLAGALYVGGLLSYFILLRRVETPLNPAPLSGLKIEAGAAWIYTLLAITWLQDTAAYFVGRRFGKRRLAPILSPKKSWEGAIAGFVTSVLVALLAMWLLGLPIHPLVAVLLGAVTGVVGPLGDLAESLIKRQIGIKDSGHLIPGHGGILDRADSLIFNVVVVYLFAVLVSMA